MNLKLSIAAAMICAAGAMACPEHEKTTNVQLVSNEAKSCATPCGAGEKSDVVLLAAFEGPEGACSGEAKACGEGDIKAVALANMPAMTYVAGKNKTECSVTAGKWAEKGKELHYVVNGAEYESIADAKAARTQALDSYLDSLTHITFVVDGKDVGCPLEASRMAAASDSPIQYRVGPAVFTSAERAIFAAAGARGASQQVAMTYEVEGKATQCSEEAGSLCEKTGAAMTYVVGETKTQCKVTATETMAQARVEAAIGAIETIASM